MELVEVELAQIVDGLAGDREAKPRGPHTGTLAVGAGVLDHNVIEPGFHPRVRLGLLPIPAIASFDPPGDPAEADLLALPVIATSLRLRRRCEHDLPIDAIEDR